jgi:hypothetical protein
MDQLRRYLKAHCADGALKLVHVHPAVAIDIEPEKYFQGLEVGGFDCSATVHSQ